MTCSVASSSIHGNQFIMFHGKNSTSDIVHIYIPGIYNCTRNIKLHVHKHNVVYVLKGNT